MKISEKQLMQLITILYDSIRAKIDIEGMFGYDMPSRLDLYNQIIKQQSEEPEEIE